jgi:hypothetical protein
MANQSSRASASPRTTAPTTAASTGLTLMKIPKKCAGIRRSTNRSARNGTAEESRPATAAQARAAGVGGCAMSVAMPIGR